MKQVLHNIKFNLLGGDSERIFGLDIMRAFAILLVLISHSSYYLGHTFKSAPKYLSVGGYLGVEIFFVLSGFLIGGMLIKIIDKKGNTYKLSDIKTFWIRRWFRTLPNYYLILFFNIVFLSFKSGHIIFDVKYLVFLQNFLTPIIVDMNYGQSWSLTIEEWFYLSIPLILLLFIKLSGNGVRKSLLYAILTVIIIYPFLKYLYFFLIEFFLNKGDRITFHFYRSVTVLRLDTLLYGVFIAYLNFYYRSFIRRSSKILFIIGILALLTIIVISEAMVFFNLENPSLVFNILFPSLGSLGLSLLIPYLNEIRASSKNIITNFITLTSIISYSLYLIHFSLVVPVVEALDFLPLGVQFLLFWILSYIFSSINYHLFESKMTSLREKFTPKVISGKKLIEFTKA